MSEVKSASDELLELAEIAPMSAGTRTKLRKIALRVAAVERERTSVAKIGGAALRQLVDAVAEGRGPPGTYGKITS